MDERKQVLDESETVDKYFGPRKFLDKSLCIIKKKQKLVEEKVILEVHKEKEIDLNSSLIEPE